MFIFDSFVVSINQKHHLSNSPHQVQLVLTGYNDKIELEDIARGLRTYSQDLLIDVDRELTDVMPATKGIIYEFVDEQSEFSKEELLILMECADISASDAKKVIDFMLYYGVLGIAKGDQDPFYIYDVNYDSEILYARMKKWGASTRYVVNLGLRPALDIDDKDFQEKLFA